MTHDISAAPSPLVAVDAAAEPAAPGARFLGAPVRTLHLEITSRCTLGCPRCQRTADPEELRVDDVSLAVLRRTITRDAFPDLAYVNLCGNYGDPIYHRQFHLVLRHFQDQGIRIRIETNGSFRSRPWWEKTAALLTRKDQVSLSIDGLEDTNHLYRVNSRWADVMAAVEALRGRVRLVWKFIVFKHNQHQVDAAVALARDLGFDEFKLIRSNRFDGRWRGADGVDPLKPDESWISDRRRVAARVDGIMHARR